MHWENVTCVLPEIGTLGPREGELGRPCETRCGIYINSLGPVQGYFTDSGLFTVVIPGLGCGLWVVQYNM